MIAQDILTIGEQTITNLLKRAGYVNVITEKKGTDFVDIEADASIRRILIHAKVLTPPHKRALPPAQIMADLKSRAAIKGREPWIAYIQLDSSGKMMGDVSWVNVRKQNP